MSTSRIGVCSWSLQPKSPDHLVAMLDQVGIGLVQLALSPVVDGPAIWREAVPRLRDAGIEILSGMMTTAGEDYSTLESIARTGGVRPDATWEANRRHAEAVADLARRHGLELVTLHAGFMPEESESPEREKLLDRLRTLADIFRDRGLTLGLETGQETADTLLDVLKTLNRANVRVNFDPANMLLYGKGEPVAALERLASYVVQIHIKDAMPAEITGSWGTEVRAGTGDVDWPAFFEIATDIDPPVDFIIERESGIDRLDDITAANELIERFLPA